MLYQAIKVCKGVFMNLLKICTSKGSSHWWKVVTNRSWSWLRWWYKFSNLGCETSQLFPHCEYLDTSGEWKKTNSNFLYYIHNILQLLTCHHLSQQCLQHIKITVFIHWEKMSMFTKHRSLNGVVRDYAPPSPLYIGWWNLPRCLRIFRVFSTFLTWATEVM